MSGRYIFSETGRLPEETPILPDLLKRRGYRTAAFIANSLVGERQGFAKGFDRFEVRQLKTDQWSAGDLNLRLLPWMKASLEPPFFLYVHYLDPHYPYAPPEELAAFPPGFDPIPKEKRQWIADYVAAHPELMAGAEEDILEMKRQIDRYDGEIRFADRCAGEILAELERLGLEDETVVVLASDHGECLWDHLHYPREVEKKFPPEDRDLTAWFFRDHGYHLFNELIQVPLIFKGPGIRKGGVVGSTVENLDILPTLLALAGENGYAFGDGRNLLPALANPEVELPEKTVVFSHCNEATCAIQPVYRLKLLAPTKVGMFFGLDYTLFDFGNDPWERENRLGNIPDASNHLLKVLEQRVKRCYFKDRAAEMDEDTRAKMRELGYAR
jgi:arylsulfatase A-like enzyme